MWEAGEPLDQAVFTRFINLLPIKVAEFFFTRALNSRFDHEVFSVRPQHSLLSQHGMINDDLPHRIITGSIVVKPNVSHFTKTGAVFDDGSELRDVDVVIFCTGYKIGFKCIDQSILPVSDNKVDLYKYVFTPNLSKPTLAVIGCVQPAGAIFPLSELQARWSTQVFSGKKFLPSKDVMMDHIEMKRKKMAQRFYASKRHTIQVCVQNTNSVIINVTVSADSITYFACYVNNITSIFSHCLSIILITTHILNIGTIKLRLQTLYIYIKNRCVLFNPSTYVHIYIHKLKD